MLRGSWVDLAQLPMSHRSPCVGSSGCSAWASSRRCHLPTDPAAEAEFDLSGLDPVELDRTDHHTAQKSNSTWMCLSHAVRPGTDFLRGENMISACCCSE
jgi:hypothetical protein